MEFAEAIGGCHVTNACCRDFRHSQSSHVLLGSMDMDGHTFPESTGEAAGRLWYRGKAGDGNPELALALLFSSLHAPARQCNHRAHTWIAQKAIWVLRWILKIPLLPVRLCISS